MRNQALGQWGGITVIVRKTGCAFRSVTAARNLGHQLLILCSNIARFLSLVQRKRKYEMWAQNKGMVVNPLHPKGNELNPYSLRTSSSLVFFFCQVTGINLLSTILTTCIY